VTELEKIERARLYMDKLANGIDPLSDEPVPDGDIINNVRLSRCFFFVSDILRKVVENGGITPPEKKQKKQPFELPFDKRETFAFSEIPIAASEIARRLNELIDTQTMKKVTYSSIATWLIGIGMLKTVETSSGTAVKRPTEEGEKLGITVEERMGMNGAYSVVVYNLRAQHFVIDNLDAMLDFKKEK
jgi:hypothetical protein